MRRMLWSGRHINVKAGKCAANAPLHRDIDVLFLVILLQDYATIKRSGFVKGGGVEGVDGLAEVSEVDNYLVANTKFVYY